MKSNLLLLGLVLSFCLPIIGHAQEKIQTDGVAVSGKTFKLKLSEVQRFLVFEYSGSVENVKAHKNLMTLMSTNFVDTSYWRTVDFELVRGDVKYQVSCFLTADDVRDRIKALDCSSTPAAVIGDASDFLQNYTQVSTIPTN